MATEHVLEDKELGRLLVRVNVRARRLTFRTREEAIHVTVPPVETSICPISLFYCPNT